jgi:hypothetical protein
VFYDAGDPRASSPPGPGTRASSRSVRRTHAKPTASLALTLGLAACGPRIQVRLYDGQVPRGARPEACNAIVYREADDVPAGYVAIGTVALGDTGLTVSCSPPEMLGELRRQTCLAGADAVHVTEVSQADEASTCMRINATLLAREAAPGH